MYVTRIGRGDFSTKRDFVDNVSCAVYMLATLYDSETSVLRLTSMTRAGQDKEVFKSHEEKFSNNGLGGGGCNRAFWIDERRRRRSG